MIITNIYSFIVVWGTIKECPFKSNINTLISSPNSAINSYCTNPYNSGTQRNTCYAKLLTQIAGFLIFRIKYQYWNHFQSSVSCV